MLRVPPKSMKGVREKASSVGVALLTFTISGTDPLSSGAKSYSNTKLPEKVFRTKSCLE